MSDYQAVYDAATYTLRQVNLSGIVGEHVERAFSHAGHVAGQAAQEALYAAYEMRRPSVLWRPKVFVDGGHWCALYGENLQDGVAGFGDSPDAAMAAFDAAWSAKIPHRARHRVSPAGTGAPGESVGTVARRILVETLAAMAAEEEG